MTRWLALAWAMGCTPEIEASGEGSHTVVQRGMLTRDQWQVRSDGTGRLEVDIEVTAGTSSLSVDVATDAFDPYVLEVIAPDGSVALSRNTWVEQPRILTDALAPSNRAASLTWPILATDPPLVPGTWTVVWALDFDEDLVDVAVHTKEDPSFEEGMLTIHLVLPGDLEADPDFMAALDEGIAVARDIYAKAGILLLTPTSTTDLDEDLDLIGSMAAAQLHREVAAPGDLVAVLSAYPDRLQGVRGTVSSTPSCLMPTEFSVMQLVVDNLRFDDDPEAELDADLFGYTLAHEIGHYLGLPHPFEKDYATWDALDDTPECNDFVDCINTFRDNVMYPGQVCDAPGDCTPNTELTPDQRGVLQRGMAVL